MGLQLIYGAKTNQSLPRYQFPKDLSLSVNPKHYSNEKKSLSMSKKLIYEIVLAYVTKERQRLVKPNQKALVLFDVSKGQTTDKVLSQYKDSNMEVVFVPTNMTASCNLLTSLLTVMQREIVIANSITVIYQKSLNKWMTENVHRKLMSNFNSPGYSPSMQNG